MKGNLGIEGFYFPLSFNPVGQFSKLAITAQSLCTESINPTTSEKSGIGYKTKDRMDINLSKSSIYSTFMCLFQCLQPLFLLNKQ